MRPGGAGPEREAAAPIQLPAPTWVDHVRSLAAWAVGGAWAVPWLVALAAGHRLLPLPLMRAIEVPYIWGQLRAVGARIRYRVDPAVDPRGAYVFLQNHVNHFDFAMLHNAVPHLMQGMNLRRHFRYPLYGWFMEARGTIPVDPGEGQTARIREAMRGLLDAGRSVLAFPEGHRTLTGRLGPFRSGVFRLARDLGAPVVPVTVVGSYELMRKGSLMIRPGREVVVHVDAPIETTGLTDAELPGLVERVRGVMAGHVDAWWAARGR